MALKMMGKKQGMTQQFDAAGNVVVCTVIHVEPNIVTQIKRKETDGYNALQLGLEKLVTVDPRTIQNRVSKPLLGHFQKSGVEPYRHLAEARVDDVEAYALGQTLDVSAFEGITHVDVSGTSKGKGFQGVMKRYNFAGGPAAHGSGFHRHGGSTGMRSTPGRNLPGTKKAGRMGNERVSVQNLRVIGLDAKRNLIIVEGAVPGPNGGVLFFAPAKKKKQKNKK